MTETIEVFSGPAAELARNQMVLIRPIDLAECASLNLGLLVFITRESPFRLAVWCEKTRKLAIVPLHEAGRAAVEAGVGERRPN